MKIMGFKNHAWQKNKTFQDQSFHYYSTSLSGSREKKSNVPMRF